MNISSDIIMIASFATLLITNIGALAYSYGTRTRAIQNVERDVAGLRMRCSMWHTEL